MQVKTAAVLPTLEAYVADAKFRTTMIESIKAKAPNGSKFVRFDETMMEVMGRWQESENTRVAKQASTRPAPRLLDLLTLNCIA